jgi:hypothetical protein
MGDYASRRALALRRVFDELVRVTKESADTESAMTAVRAVLLISKWLGNELDPQDHRNWSLLGMVSSRLAIQALTTRPGAAPDVIERCETWLLDAKGKMHRWMGDRPFAEQDAYDAGDVDRAFEIRAAKHREQLHYLRELLPSL